MGAACDPHADPCAEFGADLVPADRASSSARYLASISADLASLSARRATATSNFCDVALSCVSVAASCDERRGEMRGDEGR